MEIPIFPHQFALINCAPPYGAGEKKCFKLRRSLVYVCEGCMLPAAAWYLSSRWVVLPRGTIRSVQPLGRLSSRSWTRVRYNVHHHHHLCRQLAPSPNNGGKHRTSGRVWHNKTVVTTTGATRVVTSSLAITMHTSGTFDFAKHRAKGQGMKRHRDWQRDILQPLNHTLVSLVVKTLSLG